MKLNFIWYVQKYGLGLGCITCIQFTLPPLLVMEVMSLLVFLVTGKPAEDLRPVNGATKLAETRLTVVTAAEEIKAIFPSPSRFTKY